MMQKYDCQVIRVNPAGVVTLLSQPKQKAPDRIRRNLKKLRDYLGIAKARKDLRPYEWSEWESNPQGVSPPEDFKSPASA